jgi:hypothetical protein
VGRARRDEPAERLRAMKALLLFVAWCLLLVLLPVRLLGHRP